MLFGVVSGQMTIAARVSSVKNSIVGHAQHTDEGFRVEVSLGVCSLRGSLMKLPQRLLKACGESITQASGSYYFMGRIPIPARKRHGWYQKSTVRTQRFDRLFL